MNAIEFIKSETLKLYNKILVLTWYEAIKWSTYVWTTLWLSSVDPIWKSLQLAWGGLFIKLGGKVDGLILNTIVNKYKWWNENTFIDHFNRHWPDFWNISEIEYAKMANYFSLNWISNWYLKKVDSNWVIRYYDPDNNIFWSYNSNWTTKTFYKPDASLHPYETNMDYWNAQPWN